VIEWFDDLTLGMRFKTPEKLVTILNVAVSTCNQATITHVWLGSYSPIGMGGRGASSVAASGSWRRICSRGESTLVLSSAGGAGND
jgi:hypothetical protein